MANRAFSDDDAKSGQGVAGEKASARPAGLSARNQQRVQDHHWGIICGSWQNSQVKL